MANNWYVSSVAYAAVAQWAASPTTYSVGNIVRQLATPTVGSERCFRCSAITTGVSGSSEPTWTITHNGTTSDSGVTWIECTGQEAYQHVGSTSTWTAPAANNLDLAAGHLAVVAAGDTVFSSSDHVETYAAANTFLTVGTLSAPTNYISADRTSTVPPTASTSGAAYSTTGASTLTIGTAATYYTIVGFTFTAGNSNSAANLQLGSNSAVTCLLTNCTLALGSTNSANRIIPDSLVYLRNCTMSFGATGQAINPQTNTALDWENTSGVAALAGSTPTTLIAGTNADYPSVFCRGLDLSSVSGTLIGTAVYNYVNFKFVNCKFNASVTLPAVGSTIVWGNNIEADYEFINCAAGNNYTHLWVRSAGNVASNTTYVRSGGATDGTQTASRAMTTDNNTRCGPTNPLYHDLYVWNTKTGSSMTATVEILYSTALTNAQVWGEVEYLGDSTPSPLSSFVSSKVVPVGTPANLTSSAASWSGSLGGATAQKIALTFTPQVVGLIRFRINMVLANSTIYVDHVITLS